MNMFIFRRQNLIRFSLISIASLANLTTLDSAYGFTVNFENPDFNDGFNNDSTGWRTLGDTSTPGAFQGIEPASGSTQGLLTNSCPSIAFPEGECFDTQNPANYRQDDPNGGEQNRVFNFSGSDQGDANGNNFGQETNLQTFLGLSSNSLNIEREGGAITGTRTPKEGSAIKQTIEVTDTDKPFVISFDWNYLTNDGTDDLLGNQDYSFITIYPADSEVSDRTITILGDSTGEITTPIDPSQTDFLKVGGYMSYESAYLEPGTYVVGAGVVDVDGTGVSSGLLVDNFQVEEVPFDFSATTGLGLVASLFGLSRLRRRLKQKSN